MAWDIIDSLKRPCWYELGWDVEEIALILRIQSDYIENILDFNLSDSYHIRELKEDFKFPDFAVDFKDDIGFGGILRNHGKNEDGFWQFLAKVPQLRIAKGICSHCKGTGRDPDFNGKCLFCTDGQKYEIDFRLGDMISGSFTVLTDFLDKPCKKKTSASSSQLMTLSTMTKGCLNGYSLSGEISFYLREWLCRIGKDRDVPGITEVMRIAYKRMWGPIKDIEGEFGMIIRPNGSFIIKCPGSASGISPRGLTLKEKEGYGFASDNIDSPLQQLPLIAALSALHDRARREMKEG